jgi:hypothetical protein
MVKFFFLNRSAKTKSKVIPVFNYTPLMRAYVGMEVYLRTFLASAVYGSMCVIQDLF